MPRLVGTLTGEVVLLGGLWASRPLLGSVAVSHLGTWVRTTGPADALTALVRLGGMILAGWLLASTVVYLGATLAGADGLVRRTRWVTLPMVARLVDGMAAASIVASSVTAVIGGGTVTAAPTKMAPIPARTTATPANPDSARNGPAPAGNADPKGRGQRPPRRPAPPPSRPARPRPAGVVCHASPSL